MSEITIGNIQWFPGHMAKTRRLMRENLRLVLGQSFFLLQELRDLRLFHRPRLQYDAPAQHRG